MIALNFRINCLKSITKLKKTFSSIGPEAVYKNLVEKKILIEDSYQLGALVHLQQLYHEISSYNEEIKLDSRSNERANGWVSSLFGPNKANYSSHVSVSKPPIGLYLWGGAGCGKTYLMDLFFESLQIDRKRRVHFNNFMIDVHKRIHRLKGVSTPGNNPIKQVACDLIEEAYVLCFDEFQVTDIADAMILKLLFSEMFNYGGIVIATSNRPPEGLYKNGIQRELFQPFIPFLSSKCHVHSLSSSPTDFRLVKHSHGTVSHVYCHPISNESTQIFNAQFLALCEGKLSTRKELTVYGHTLTIPQALYYDESDQEDAFLGDLVIKKSKKIGKVARFTFEELCESALGSSDYITLAEEFDYLFLDNIPKMNLNNRNQVRRFITLIDCLYESSVILFVLAEAPPKELFDISKEEKEESTFDEVFAFDRTVSRLMEMQSEVYLLSRKK